MGYCRGVPSPHNKRARLERLAAEMRARNLYSGRGCATRRKVIAARQKDSQQFPAGRETGKSLQH